MCVMKLKQKSLTQKAKDAGLVMPTGGNRRLYRKALKAKIKELKKQKTVAVKSQVNWFEKLMDEELSVVLPLDGTTVEAILNGND